jgi:hypothetical protein
LATKLAHTPHVANQAAQPRDRTLLAIGGLTAAGGFYLLLAGLGLAPPPGPLHGPLWIGACAGFAFMIAGLGVIIRGAARMGDNDTEMPPGTPHWLDVIYSLMGVAVAASLAAIGSWVAFGGGERHFSISGFLSGPGSEVIGRSVFGFGAILSWLIVAVFARMSLRKIFGR